MEDLPAPTAAHFSDLTFADAADPAPLMLFRAAADQLMTVSDLGDAVGQVVRSAHPLVAARDHDVSHSNPDLPFSIFVSVPRADEQNAAIRLTESMMHEAMHLQLSLIETVVPIVEPNATSGFSPWQQRERPAQGLLHGLYVFAIIFQAFDALARTLPSVSAYCTDRRLQITSEVRALTSTPRGLTAFGASLWERAAATVLDAA